MNVNSTIQGGLDLNPPVSGQKGINPANAEKYAGKSACVIGAGFGGMDRFAILHVLISQHIDISFIQ